MGQTPSREHVNLSVHVKNPELQRKPPHLFSQLLGALTFAFLERTTAAAKTGERGWALESSVKKEPSFYPPPSALSSKAVKRRRR
eukprot:274357-Chlamydomonas_euryale.AAC.8